MNTQVRTARVQAALMVNVELIGLYGRIGRLIRNRRQHEGWGSRMIGRLAADLRAEFPGMRGFSPHEAIEDDELPETSETRQREDRLERRSRARCR